MATWLTSAPHPQHRAEDDATRPRSAAAPDGDNLSAIVVRWGPETLTDEPATHDRPKRWAWANSQTRDRPHDDADRAPRARSAT